MSTPALTMLNEVSVTSRDPGSLSRSHQPDVRVIPLFPEVGEQRKYKDLTIRLESDSRASLRFNFDSAFILEDRKRTEGAGWYREAKKLDDELGKFSRGVRGFAVTYGSYDNGMDYWELYIDKKILSTSSRTDASSRIQEIAEGLVAATGHREFPFIDSHPNPEIPGIENARRLAGQKCQQPI